MDITGYEDRTRGFNAGVNAFSVAKRRIDPWWCPLQRQRIIWEESEAMSDFCGVSMDAPDLLPSGGMKSLSFGGRQVIVNSREWLKTPFEDAIDAAFPND